MRQYLAEAATSGDGMGKIIIAVIIIMALWGQKTNRGGK